MQFTSQQYNKIISDCHALFVDKIPDYGSAWRILRLPSLKDQIFIKAQRIRQLQENNIERSMKMKSLNLWILSIIQLWL